MVCRAKYLAAVIFLTFPTIAQSQSAGQVECPRSGGYVYLYSSMVTLDVRTTLQCGEQVQITGRYDLYFGVRTAKGDVGYVPVDSLLLLKDKPGGSAPQPKTVQPNRERILYDAPAAAAEAAPSAASDPSVITLRNGTPLHLKLEKTISSATSHAGDAVELRVTADVFVDGFLVIPSGATATGVVTEAEPKKRLGHGGKLAFSINFVQLKDSEKAAVRSFQESSGANNAILPLASGKDVVYTQGAGYTAYVDGDMKLKKESFPTEKGAPSSAPAKPSSTPAQPRGL
jgi:hypothetical protein